MGVDDLGGDGAILLGSKKGVAMKAAKCAPPTRPCVRETLRALLVGLFFVLSCVHTAHNKPHRNKEEPQKKGEAKLTCYSSPTRAVVGRSRCGKRRRGRKLSVLTSPKQGEKFSLGGEGS